MRFFRNNKLKYKKLHKHINSHENTEYETYSDLKYKSITSKLKNLLIILVTANILILFSIVLLVYTNTENNRNFNSIIFRIDKLLVRNNYDLSQEHITEAFNYCKTRKNALILLKRQYRVSEYTENYEILESLSRKLFLKYKKDSRIRNIYLFSLLRTDNIDLFLTTYKKRNTSDFFKNDLFLEYYSTCKSNEKIICNNKIKDHFNDNIYINLLDDSLNPDKYLEIYEKEGNSNFLNNYIILKMKEGEKKEALKYLSALKINPLLQALILLDNRSFIDSLNIISGIDSKNTDLQFIQADIEMYLGNYDKSSIIYKNIYNSGQISDNLSLMNLIWIEYIKTGNINSEYLISLIDKKSKTNITNILYYINLNKYISEIQKEMLNSSLNAVDELLSCRKENRDRYLKILWNILNNYNTDDDYKKYLAYYLLENRKIKDLQILLQKNEIRNSQFFNLYKAFCEISVNNYSDAFFHYSNYLENNLNRENYFNLALISIKKENYSEALKYLDTAILKKNSTKEYLSSIYFWKAYTYYRTGIYSKSYDFLNKSISADRSNLNSKFLLNHIKSKIVES